MASPNLNEILTTTLRNRAGKVRDTIEVHDPLIKRLKAKGRIRQISGGRSIVTELEYAENESYHRYAGYEQLNITPQEVFTAAEYGWRLAAYSVSISGQERLMNSGKEALVDLLEGRITNAERSAKNNFLRDVWSDGTASGGKQIGGIQHLISSAGTGTVGGIDSSTWTFWRNQVLSFATESLTVTNAAHLLTLMNKMWVRLVINEEKPDLILASNDLWLLYLSSLQGMQRITQDSTGQAGFSSLKFMSADVVLSQGQSVSTSMSAPAVGTYGTPGNGAPSTRMDFINSDTLELRPHRNRNWDPIGEDRAPLSQDSIVKLVGWMGNMVANRRHLNGVIVA